MWTDKVVWQEGMFLRAQHMQQQDRHFMHVLHARTAPLHPYPWGLAALSIDRDLLAAGKFAITHASGILPDGTPFSIPETTDQPRPLDLPDGTRDQIVYLAAVLSQAGSPEVALGEDRGPRVGTGFGDGPDGRGGSRYRQRSFEAYDMHSDSALPAELLIGRLQLRLMLESEERAGLSCLGLARITEVQADRRVVVDERYMPPCLRITAATALANLPTELTGMLGQRTEALAARLSQPGARGVSEVADFLLLQALNRWLPLLGHWSSAGHVHPETLYVALVQMAGELATFTDPSRRAQAYPPYRHEDLQRTFLPVVADLRRALSAVLETSAVEIPLQDRRNGLRVGPINDRTLLRASQFVLTARADLPDEQLRRVFPAQVKVGAVEHIRELVNVAMPGIAVRPLPVAPRQIPFHAGAVYFELDRGSAHWQQMLSSGGFAIHVSGDFPNLDLALWAIRA